MSEGKGHSITRLFDSITKLIWAVVVLLVLAGLGRLFVFKSTPEGEGGPGSTVRTAPTPVVTPVPWDEVDQALLTAIQNAHARARALAEERLDVWVGELTQRIDEDFLDWYFGYWNQQIFGITGLYQSVAHWVDGDQPTAGERLTEEFQEEFTQRVLRPQIAQLRLERITIEVVDLYVNALGEELAGIPERYDISRADWDRYLEDIAVLGQSSGSVREVPLSLKALTGATAAGSVVLASALKPAMAKLGGQVSSKVWGKAVSQAAGQMAAKTGGKVAAKTGGKMLGWIIGVGIIVWDVFDHYSSRGEQEPVLRDNLLDYVGEMRQTLLDDHDSGVMSVIHAMELSIRSSLS
jgi:hypothetical protein